jgi:hypothetical protein
MDDYERRSIFKELHRLFRELTEEPDKFYDHFRMFWEIIFILLDLRLSQQCLWGVVTSGLWQFLVRLKSRDVSEECVASIFRVEIKKNYHDNQSCISTQLTDVTLTKNIRGRAIAQVVSRRLPTSAAPVKSCGICGGQSGAGADFLQVRRFPLPSFIPPTAPQSPSSVIWGWRYRPIEAAVPSRLSLTPLGIVIIKNKILSRALVTCRQGWDWWIDLLDTHTS